MIYSFDIFDTVLTRCVANPRAVFLLMQKKLSFDQRFSAHKNILRNFSFLRFKAELKARLKAFKEDISLGAIYNELFQYIKSQEITDLLKQEEIITEKSLLRPINFICEKIKNLQIKKERVIFISDMYLSSEILTTFLTEKTGLNISQKDIYVSGEVGLRKTTGGLFKYVFKKENIKSCELIHYGDNLLSDCLIPSKMGIKIYANFQ